MNNRIYAKKVKKLELKKERFVKNDFFLFDRIPYDVKPGSFRERFLHLFPTFSFVKLYTAYTISCIVSFSVFKEAKL